MSLNRVFQIGGELGGGDGAVNSTSVEGWREIGNFAGEINLYSGGNLRRSDSDHSNLFQGQKQNAVNIEH